MSKQVISSGAFTDIKITGDTNLENIYFDVFSMRGDDVTMFITNEITMDAESVLITNDATPRLYIQQQGLSDLADITDVYLIIRNGSGDCKMKIVSGAADEPVLSFNAVDDEKAVIKVDKTDDRLSLEANGGIKMNGTNYPEINDLSILGLTMGTKAASSGTLTLDYINSNVVQTLIKAITRLFVPLYVYPDGPGGVYNQVGNSMQTTLGRVDVVINPNNGNDALAPPNADWVRDMNAMQADAGIYWSTDYVFGYTFTQFGARAIEDVYAIIDGYVDNGWVWVGGIFFDEVSNDPADIEYYRSLVEYTVGRGLQVVLNTGVPANSLLEGLDGVLAIVSNENTFVSLPNLRVTNEQLLERDPRRHIFIANQVPTADDIPVAEEAYKRRNFGRFYMTDAANYNALSAYFAALVADLALQ